MTSETISYFRLYYRALYQIAFDVDGPEERAALGGHGF